MNARSIGELSGEIWAEINMAAWDRGEKIDVELLGRFIDVTSGVLARHVGKTIENDSDCPVEPLPVKLQQADKVNGP